VIIHYFVAEPSGSNGTGEKVAQKPAPTAWIRKIVPKVVNVQREYAAWTKYSVNVAQRPSSRFASDDHAQYAEHANGVVKSRTREHREVAQVGLNEWKRESACIAFSPRDLEHCCRQIDSDDVKTSTGKIEE
jgi:hypothetical protein